MNLIWDPTIIRISQQKARPTPPPKHDPLMRAIVVFGQALTHSNVDKRLWSWDFVVPEVAGPDELKSIPAQKYFPVFVRIIV